jgi:hypothetical protein
MPIGKDEWNRGKKNRSIEGRVLSFLEQDKAYAFTAEEIMNRLGENVSRVKQVTKGSKGEPILQDYVKALDNLQQEGAIESKKIENETYYRAIENRTLSDEAREKREPL